MPFKSLAHREKLRKLVDEGSFPKQDFQTLSDESIGLDLPERAARTQPSKPKPGRAARSYDRTANKPQY